jgi:proteic killer suppression protein
MIRGFSNKETAAFFFGDKVPAKWKKIEGIAKRKLDMLNAATLVSDLRSPPGNRLEILRGDRAGQYSMRINAQWRICFVWMPLGPALVEIVDYH